MLPVVAVPFNAVVSALVGNKGKLVGWSTPGIIGVHVPHLAIWLLVGAFKCRPKLVVRNGCVVLYYVEECGLQLGTGFPIGVRVVTIGNLTLCNLRSKHKQETQKRSIDNRFHPVIIPPK